LPQYAVTTLAHATPSPPTRPTRPRPPRPAPASPNCSRHAAASAQARCQLTGRVVLGFRPNPLGGILHYVNHLTCLHCGLSAGLTAPRNTPPLRTPRLKRVRLLPTPTSRAQKMGILFITGRPLIAHAQPWLLFLICTGPIVIHRQPLGASGVGRHEGQAG
jgi:hypothetical protein